ncbi:aspartate-semialdehyde dehydrogenase [Vibrio sp. RC27]
MSQEFNIALLGASEPVGEAIIDMLQEREFPMGDLILLASEPNEEKSYRVDGKSLYIQEVADFDWSQVHLAFFCESSESSEQWASVAADEGVIVIDSTERYRYDYDVPLVIPEVNPEAISEFRNRNVIASPSATTVQLLVALKPIHDAFGVERVNVSTYQSVSAAGKAGVDELAGQTARLLNGLPPESDHFSQTIAFNCLPQVDQLTENGYTREEMALVLETQKVFNDPSIAVNPTCVIVPVFYGHAATVHLETRTPVDVSQVTELLEQAPSIQVFNGHDFPTTVRDATGKDEVMVGRIRNDISHHSGINFWVVADNVRKGSAINAIQIAQLLIDEYL